SANWRRLLWLPLLLLLLSSRTLGDSSALSSANERWGLRLASSLGLEQAQSNVAVSPLLLQAALTLLYAGVASNSATQQQLRVALELQQLGSSPAAAVQHFVALLTELKQTAAIGCQLRLLSAFYTQQRYTFNFRDEFERQAAALSIGVQRLDFDDLPHVAQSINYEFLKRSNYSVGAAVSAADADAASDTPFLHVSALTFHAPWLTGFDPQQTQRLNFFNSAQSHKLVDAMFVQHRFRYAELAAFDACLIELPFAVAELSMLIIYPNRLDGLPDLERKLQSSEFELWQLRQQLSERKLSLTLPKFNLLAHTELRHTLEQLGLSKLFSSEAQLHKVFSSLLASSAPHLTAVAHTALLELHEAGGTADQSFFASFADLFRSTQSLVINHPFFYAIGNDKALLLAGHVVDI
ncbi:Spn43Ad, partial [Drosophila busckii]